MTGLKKRLILLEDDTNLVDQARLAFQKGGMDFVHVPVFIGVTVKDIQDAKKNRERGENLAENTYVRLRAESNPAALLYVLPSSYFNAFETSVPSNLEDKKLSTVQTNCRPGIDPNYWTSLDVSPEDLVVLDLNLTGAFPKDIEPKQRYGGKDTLKLLQELKNEGRLSGLEKVLVATSIKGEVDPRRAQVDFLECEGFDVYGMEKGVQEAVSRTSEFGTGAIPSSKLVAVPSAYKLALVRTVQAIYEGDIEPLNKGWREQ